MKLSLVIALVFGCEAATLELAPVSKHRTPSSDAGATPPMVPDASIIDASTETQRAAALSPEWIDFGSVQVGWTVGADLAATNPNRATPVRVTLENELPAAFTVAPRSLLLDPGATRTFHVTFTPSEPIAYGDYLQVDACADDDCIRPIYVGGAGYRDEPRPDAGPAPTACGNSGPCPNQLTFGPVPVGTTAQWNFFCSCPEALGYDSAMLEPALEGASIRLVEATWPEREDRLFLTFTPTTAGDFETNIAFRGDAGQLVVPLLLIAE